MRLRNLRTPIAIVSLICGIAACGGTSSETPEPERPDSWQLKLRQARNQGEAPATTESSDATDITGLPIRNLDEPGPAKSTWGGKRRPPVRAVAIATSQASAAPASEPAPAKKSVPASESAPAKKSVPKTVKKSPSNVAPPATSAAPTLPNQN